MVMTKAPSSQPPTPPPASICPALNICGSLNRAGERGKGRCETQCFYSTLTSETTVTNGNTANIPRAMTLRREKQAYL